MPTFSITYSYQIPGTYDFSMEWRVTADNPARNFPTLFTGGPQNAIKRPTLIFPNGNEVLYTREVEISWQESVPPTTDKLDVFYELFYSENYDFTTEPDWKMIACIPAGIGRYNWRVGNNFKSKNMRCGVRAVNSRGERSDMSISASSFTINKALPLTPVVLSPLPNTRYSDTITFVFEDTAILNTFAQRAKYSMYFSSDKLSIPLSPIAENIPVGSGPIVWDTANVADSDDYVLTVFLRDDDGNKSQEVNIRNVAIIHDSFFLVDTQEPLVYVEINDNAVYTKNRDVSVKIYAFDNTTNVHALQLNEITQLATGEQTTVAGPIETYAEIKSYQLSEQNGIKTLIANIQDFAGNRPKSYTQPWKVLLNVKTRDVVDMIVFGDTNKIIVAANNATGYIYILDPNPSLLFETSKSIASLGSYKDVLYISYINDSQTAEVVKYANGSLASAFGLTEENSQIIAMTSYVDNLYVATRSSSLYRYNGATLAFLRSFESQINRIYTDQNFLYVTFKNSENIFVYDGNTFTEILT